MMAEERDIRTETDGGERIVVALDASPSSVAALRAATDLAALLGVELEGLFVEDIDLMRLCGMPNLHEVGSYTGAVRRLDDRSLDRQMRALARSMQQAMAREAQRRPVRWTFQVRRGLVVAELLAAAHTASLVSLGRTSRGRRLRLGSTAEVVVRESPRPVLLLGDGGELRSPLTALYTGTEGSERALRFAVSLQRRNGGGLRVFVWSQGDGQRTVELTRELHAVLQQSAVEASVVVATGGELGMLLAREAGTLVLPREQAALLGQLSGPTILVP